MFANLDGWEGIAIQRLTFAKTDHAKMEEFVRTMRMPTFVNVLKDTVVTTASITERYAIGTLANMVVLVSVVQVDTMATLVFALQEQLEIIVRKIPETNVPIVHAKMEHNVLTVSEILIVIVRLNLEVKTVKSMTSHRQVE